MDPEYNNASTAVNGTTQSVEFEGYLLSLKISIGIMCILSIIGAALIILTFIIFKDIRTRPRQLLVNLSLADMITAVFNLLGMLINFEKYLDYQKIPVENQTKFINDICITQAATSQYATNASILWTISIAFYMFIVVVLRKDRLALILSPVYYLVSWGVPLVITVWFASVGYFGFEPETTPGWCNIIGTLRKSEGNSTTRIRVVYPIIIGYNVLVYIAFLILPALYISIRCHVKILIKKTNGQLHLNLQSISKSTDLKMIFIPIIFIFIRTWGLVVDAVDFYADKNIKHRFEFSIVGSIFILAKGIGDSSQGFANAVLFVGLTKPVRVRLWRLIKTLVTCQFCCRYERSHLLESITESTNVASLLSTNDQSHYGALSVSDSLTEYNMHRKSSATDRIRIN